MSLGGRQAASASKISTRARGYLILVGKIARPRRWVLEIGVEMAKYCKLLPKIEVQILIQIAHGFVPRPRIAPGWSYVVGLG